MYSKFEFSLHSALAIVLLLVDRWVNRLKKLFGSTVNAPNYIEGVNLVDNVVVITGANIGIGRETALNLACCGATVVLGCRDIQKGMQAAKDINTYLGSTEIQRQYPFSAKGRVVFMRLNLSELTCVFEFAIKMKAEFPRVDILINNAGLNTGGTLASGLEQLFQVNYLGHYLLVRCLQSHLSAMGGKNAPPCARVVNLSSVTHHTGQPDFKRSSTGTFTVAMKAKYSYYADSKLYMNYLTLGINRRMDSATAGGKSQRPTVAISVNPGAVRSDIWRNYPFQRIYNMIMKLIFLEVEEGCASSVFAATVKLDALREYQQGLNSAPDIGGRFIQRADMPYAVPYKVVGSCLAHEVVGVHYGCYFSGMSLPTAQEVRASRPEVLTEDASPSRQATALWKYSSELCVKDLLANGLKESDISFLLKD